MLILYHVYHYTLTTHQDSPLVLGHYLELKPMLMYTCVRALFKDCHYTSTQNTVQSLCIVMYN